MPDRSIPAHYQKISKFEGGSTIGLKEAVWENWRIVRHMGQNDFGLNGWAMADCSITMVSVDLGPQQIGSPD
ncbi:hypothetical protein TNCV_4591861 [Trichonephila clavipes]|nr:hypothetical protein TNCV_4591861 [Trichonephila clavipes]